MQKTAVPTCQTLKKNNIMPIIKYKNVDINIDSKVILENVSFTLEAGEFAYIIGQRSMEYSAVQQKPFMYLVLPDNLLSLREDWK